jgi:transposase
MTTTTIEVTGGVDTHRDTHHAAALDQVGRLLGTQEFPAEPAGYQQLLTWLESFGTLTCVGVEGTGCYGAGLTRFLRRRRLRVIEVNRPDRRSRRLRGKSDPLDAESAARRALAGEDQVIPKDTTTIVEAIRVLRIARSGAVKSRTAACNQLKDLTVTAPDELRQTLRGKSSQRVAAESARLRPDLTRLADPTHATKLALRSAIRIDALGSEIAGLDKQLHQLVALAAPRTLSLLGVGPDHAAQLLRSCSSPRAATPNGSGPKPRSPRSARPAPSPPAAARPTGTASTGPAATGTRTAPPT